MQIQMDFTLKTYTSLLKALLRNGYDFFSFEKYHPQLNNSKIVILRHDVDKSPVNSFKTALIEHELGITGTYYFRIVKQSFNREIIKNIAALGHEIGYHYEDLALANGDLDKAIQKFEKNLNSFSDLYNVKTIAMHGSPTSKFDNRMLWQHFKYQDFGITKEPYFDIDFSEMLYLTDTGRCWNGKSVSVRDKELATSKPPLSLAYHFKTTWEIIEAADNGMLATHIMLNFHPQRWTDNLFEWSKELIMQQIKNPIKKIIVRKNNAMAN
jgi:hypothetical protein